MKAEPPTFAPPSLATRSERFHLWRSRKDAVVKWLIAVGGISVIGAVVLIFFYLLWVVLPLFIPANTVIAESRDVPRWTNTSPVYFALEEQQEVGLRISNRGDAEFFRRTDVLILDQSRFPILDGQELTVSAEAIERDGHVAVAANDGQVYIAKHSYETSFEGGVETRKISPLLEFPYGESAVLDMPENGVIRLAYSDNEDGFLLAAARGSLVRVNRAAKTEDLLTGEVMIEPSLLSRRLDFDVTAMAVSGNHRWLYLGDSSGRIHNYTFPGLKRLEIIQVSTAPVTTMSMLLGGISLLVGDQEGVISQLFPVRNRQNDFELKTIRQFESLGTEIVRILPEARRKGFLAVSEGSVVGIFHSTANRLVHRESLSGFKPLALALSPRANGLMMEGSAGRLGMMDIRNEHPEISFSSLWRKVWYENYDEPRYVWQSSASSNEFEPKFSLTPLVFGTLKAAAYAMLFAIPLALMGAAYTAYFMSPELRRWVKPGIEVMAALPTVILGFLAGLWFAPWVEEHLLHLFLMLLFIPPGLLAFSWTWHRWDHPVKDWVPAGWEPVLLLPALVLTIVLALWVADPVQMLFFQGNLRDWLSHEAGISYDQRNAVVVGCAMGFAVIPTIFSIAEDAIFGVPESLSNGSLALGATPWQTLVFVVLPTASPGIFSALMIGLGRAVGETMIVLMATGNTPVMDWSLFEGMRTLAANIAVEMPESEVNGSHYRILFLAALVLFLFTFVVNTGAEVIRHRLREKYSSL